MTDPQQPSGSPPEPSWAPPQPPTPPSYGEPASDQPSYGQPSYGQPEPPTTIQPGYDPAYAQPAYGAPGYGQPYGQPVYVNRPTNGMAIAALVCSLAGLFTFISAPVGAVLGHVARKQIQVSGEQGDGMALAGIIVGWVVTGLYVCGCGAYFGFFALIFAGAAAGA